MNRLWTMLLLASLAARAGAGPVILEGDSWRYYKGNSTPSNNWNQIGFGDAGWGGPAPSGFGYGDGDDATVFSDMENAYVSAFIRKRFVIASTANVTHLTLAADYDDGFVAYINGVEVARRNMPGGAVNHTTTASAGREVSRGTPANTPEEKEFINLSTAVLVPGTNVLAVSGHNANAASSDFSMIFELYTNITLLRGPYIQRPTSDGVSVVWRTDALCDGVVDFGIDTNYAAGSVTSSAAARTHVVPLTGLAAGSTYCYRVRSGGEILSQGHVFRAPPAAGQSFRFAVIGDFGGGSANSQDVADQVAGASCDLVLTAGDNIYLDGQPGDYDAFWFTPYAAVMRRAPMMPALGNHDIHCSTGQWLAEYFYLPTNGPAGLAERNYSFDFGNAHVAVMDSNPFESGDAATMNAIKAWLTNDLASTTQRWKFVVHHHPPRTSMGSHDDTPAMSEEIEPFLARYGVHLAFQGHNHFYERINPVSGVTYITSGGGGLSLHALTSQRAYSAKVVNDAYSFVLVDVDADRLTLRAVDQNGTERDVSYIELDHPFRMDGLIDNTSWGRATNNLILYAAIRSNFLYVATQDAGEGNDHFIYLGDGQATSRPANWVKSGSVMQWDAFLADENDSGFSGWFGPGEEPLTAPSFYRAVTSGLNNNSNTANGVLEGSIDLRAHWPSFPPRLYVAVAPYVTTNGGHLLAWSQVPAGNSSPNINSNEFLVLDTRSLALDPPVANAGEDQVVEAGMVALLDGTASTSPGGFALTSVWARVSGPESLVTNAAFITTGNVASATNAVVRLVVNDTRFDSTDTVVVTVLPMLDSDGDGLSDFEEGTGVDNLLTAANPAGHVTATNSADSDGDGAGDGDEALAGTDPNANGSVFEVVQGQPSDAGLVITWSSVSGRFYNVDLLTNLMAPRMTLTTNLAATPPINAYTVPVSGVQEFYLIRIQP